MSQFRFISLVGVPVLLLSACVVADTGGPASNQSARKNSAIEAATIQVEVLSRGRGVPEDAMRAYQDIKIMVEREYKSDAGIKEQVLGLEGERRMCIVIENAAQADALFEKISVLARDIELMHISMGRCESASGGSFEEEDHEP